MNDSLPLLIQETAAETGFTLEWIDWLGAGICGLFTLLGLLRGLWWQVIRLVGLVGAAFLARFLSGPWGDWLAETTDMPSEVATGLVWVGVFIVGIVITALLGTIGKKSLEAMKLGFVDRFGGLVAGLATGLVLHSAILLGLAYLSPQNWMQKTLEGTYSKSVLEVVTTQWPILARKQTESGDYLRTLLDSGSSSATEEAESSEEKKVD